MESTPSKLMVSITLGALAATAASPAAAVEIPWSAERKLVWSDFEGSVPASSPPENVAVTAASLGWSYEYEFERAGGACRYRVTDIRSTAVFHSADSWVRDGHRNAHILAHEQGHFDMTQAYKLALDRRMRPLIGTAGSCAGKNARRISRRVEQDIVALIEPIFMAVWQEHMDRQSQYDAETDHGRAAVAQGEWLEKIASALAAQGWPARLASNE